MAQNSGCKSKGVRGRSLKTLQKSATKRLSFFCFWLLLASFINCNTFHVCNIHWYTTQVKLLLKFELIKAYLSSFRLFSAHLSLVTSDSLGPFWAQIESFWIYSGSTELFASLRSFMIVQDVLGLFCLIWAVLRLFRLIDAHLP